jgi:hypothetical protein
MHRSVGKVFVLLFVVLLALGACATTGGPLETERENDSLVFGYLDMSEAKGHFDWVQMQQLQPPTDKPYYNFYVEDGVFWHPRVQPGTFKFIKFGGTDGLTAGPLRLFSSTSYEYAFPRQGQGEMDPIVDKQGLYYVGSYKVVVKKGGLFKPGEFDIVPTGTPSEGELLQQLLAKAEEGEWRSRIEQRLAELQ